MDSTRLTQVIAARSSRFARNLTNDLAGETGFCHSVDPILLCLLCFRFLCADGGALAEERKMWKMARELRDNSSIIRARSQYILQNI